MKYKMIEFVEMIETKKSMSPQRLDALPLELCPTAPCQDAPDLGDFSVISREKCR